MNNIRFYLVLQVFSSQTVVQQPRTGSAGGRNVVLGAAETSRDVVRYACSIHVRGPLFPVLRIGSRRRRGHAGVVVNDAPAFREAARHQGEDAPRPVLLPLQFPVAQNHGGIGAERGDL